jgi:hypothetical protein
MLLLAAFAAVLYGLKDSHELSQGLAAARYGIAAMLGLWLLHEIASWTRTINANLEKSRQTPDIMSPVWPGATQRPAVKPGETMTSPSDVPPVVPPGAPTTLTPPMDSSGDHPRPQS